MGFAKVQKNKAYYKRLQTKYRRRREGKTDYHARRKMVCQDKNKYNTPKYRLICRITNTKVICQIAYATIQGDRLLCQAVSTELSKYGMPVGHTNYGACYATGLLIARRALEIVGLADSITGVETCTAEEFHVEEEENERRPFKVVLDVGLIRTIPGSRVFGILKGAVDGGLHVPHTTKNFPGSSEDAEGKVSYDAAAHLERITGVHVQEFMENLQEEDPERYKVAFSKYIANDIEPESLPELYATVHAAIRKDPKFEKKKNAGITHVRAGVKITSSNGTSYNGNRAKMSYQQRKDRVKQKMAAARTRLMAAMGDDEEAEDDE